MLMSKAKAIFGRCTEASVVVPQMGSVQTWSVQCSRNADTCMLCTEVTGFSVHTESKIPGGDQFLHVVISHSLFLLGQIPKLTDTN